MLFLKFVMLLERIHSLRFLRIQTVKAFDIEHGGLSHWIVVHFSQGLVQELHPLG
jgi:hypothetical protein